MRGPAGGDAPSAGELRGGGVRVVEGEGRGLQLRRGGRGQHGEDLGALGERLEEAADFLGLGFVVGCFGSVSARGKAPKAPPTGRSVDRSMFSIPPSTTTTQTG